MYRRITATAFTALAVAAGGAQVAQAGGSAADAQALKALEIRSAALNREYHLGAYAAPARSTAGQALAARSAALDRAYHLGAYAVVKPSDGFNWTDAGIGAAAILGAVALAGGGVSVARRSRGYRPERAG